MIRLMPGSSRHSMAEAITQVLTKTEAPTQVLTKTEAPTEVLTTLTQEIRLRLSHQRRRENSQPAPRDRVAVGVAITAAAVSIAACVYFYREPGLLGYHDSYAHLEIGRRLLVGRTTGIAQLGAIWLPLPHILQAALAWNWTLYITGLAGAIVSMTSFVVSATLIYRIVRVFSPNSVAPGIVAATVFMLNPNMLYHQTTAMDELPFYAFALAAIFGLIRWADTKRPTYVLSAAIASMLAMLCRYEGWFLAGVLTVMVLIMARQTGHSWRDARGLAATFATFGAMTASTAWLIYNWLVAGSPLNFLYGPHSSADQMSRRTTDVQIGSWSKTLRTYGDAMVADHGWLVLALAALGLVVFLAFERFSARSLPVLALSTIVPFYLHAIEAGQIPIGVPPVNEYLLNLRFALVALLPAALVIGYLVARLPRRAVLIASILTVVALTAVNANVFRQDNVVTVREVSQHLADQALQADVGDFLEQQTAGPILLNLVGNERTAFPVLDRVIYEGTKSGNANIWSQALRSPQSVGAQVVLMRNSKQHGVDEVYAALHNKPAMAKYRVVLKNEDYTVYVFVGALPSRKLG
jgi:hypothetical protein